MNGEPSGTLNSMLGHPQLQLLRASTPFSGNFLCPISLS
jgi:hypothetical protein